jgi:two-component system nitrogen regulation response regulator GlnG
MPTLLVIDDEPNIHYSVEAVFAGSRVQVVGANTAEEGLRLAAEVAPDVILLDIKLGPQSGLEVFQELQQFDPKCLVIFITGHGSADTTIEAMKLGAYDYLTKPLDADQLLQVVEQAFEIGRLMRVPAIIEEGNRAQDRPDLLVGCGPQMQAVYKQVGRVAPLNINVLILGESGTGKELVARAIYHHSRRNPGPFLAINCAAIPETLLESELFGHERGAFTGAVRRRIGKFEQCHHGILFLDEVADMPANTQAKFLRVLQEGRFERIGGNETITTDVRIIAATNQDLEALIEQGRFRKDLYYRLRGVTIHLPALRDRPEDIPELAHYFLFRYNRQNGTSVNSIAPEALHILQRYPWPGNVRELQSVIHEALIKTTGHSILPDVLPADLRQRADPAPPTISDAPWRSLTQELEAALSHGEKDLYRRGLEHFDRWLIGLAMQHADSNQVRAAEILGVSRVTLRAKLRALGMSIEKVLAPRDEA